MGTRHDVVSLASDDMFKNMLQLKIFGLCFEEILKTKWRLTHINNDISY